MKAAPETPEPNETGRLLAVDLRDHFHRDAARNAFAAPVVSAPVE